MQRIFPGDMVHPSNRPSPQHHSPKKKKLKKMFHPWKKLISMQRCRGLWGSFGLASYVTLNAIYWIIDLLCSQNCAEKSQPVFGLEKKKKQRTGLKARETMKVDKDAGLCAGWWKHRWGLWEEEEAVQHSSWPRHLIWRANKMRE